MNPIEQHDSKAPEPAKAPRSGAEALSQNLPSELRRHKPPKEALEAAWERFQSIAAEVDAEEYLAETGIPAAAELCPSCGHKNREGNRFCARCGSPLGPDNGRDGRKAVASVSSGLHPDADAIQGSPHDAAISNVHQHHHHHYHYFPGAADGARHPASSSRESEKAVALPGQKGEIYSRAETAVRRLTQDWAVACNTKQLEDVLDLYGRDPLVYRSNQPAVRGAAALREFFFAALGGGLGEVAIEPARVEVTGDMACEAGKFTALVPAIGGKRREERGKYVWVLSKNAEGEWKIAVDCWSNDLTLGPDEPVKAVPTPRKT